MAIFECCDVVTHIMQYLTDIEKTNVLRCSKLTDSIQCTFGKNMLLTNIFHFRRYHSFTNVIMDTAFYNIYTAQSICGQKKEITLPRNATELTLQLSTPFSEIIKLPDTITHVAHYQHSSNFWKSITRFVTHLSMSGYNFHPPTDCNLSVTHLTVTGGIEIKHIPDSIRHLTLVNYNHPMNNLVAPITHLTFVGHHNSPVDNLPRTITHLTFSTWFNSSFGTLPSKLTHLTFGNNYNQRVDDLPDTITHLTFGECFNHSVNKLPQSLTHLTFGSNFNSFVDKLPPYITHLTFGLRFNRTVTQLPPNITHLTFGDQFAKSIARVPQSVTHLVLGQKFKCKLDKLPRCLTHLTLSTSYALIHLPATITVVRV